MRAASCRRTRRRHDAFAPQQTFRAGVDLVHFGVGGHRQAGRADHRVEGGRLRARRGGQAADDHLLRRGVSGDGDLGRVLPLHLGLALDTSGSMEADINDVRTGMIKFLNANEHAVDTTLVDFDTEVRLARYGRLRLPAADRAHPHAEAGRLDGVLRRRRRLPQRRGGAGRREDSRSSTPTAATRAAR